jgi:hypothetical protein
MTPAAQKLFELFTSMTQQGREVCKWDDLPPLVRDAWEAVRQAVLTEGG